MNKNEDFYSLGIALSILSILNGFNFNVSTPIQIKSILPVIEDKDLIGIAQTGAGKTLAFGIPIIHSTIGFKRQKRINYFFYVRAGHSSPGNA